jgi:hypothetical protein
LCRKQAEVIQNHENEHVRGIVQGEARHRKYKRLKLGGGKLATVQVTKLSLQHKIRKIGMICSVKPVLKEDLCVVQKEQIFNNMLYMCEIFT